MYGIYKIIQSFLLFLGVIMILYLLATPLAGAVILFLLVGGGISFLSGARRISKPRSAYVTRMEEKERRESNYFNNLDDEYEAEARKRKAEWQSKK